MTLTYPRDIFGQRTGIWDQRPSLNWTGWDIYWSRVAGQRLNMGGASAYIDHADAIGSTVMETDPAGGVQWDITRYPWGQIWQQGGTRESTVFAGLDWRVNDPLYPSATREYSPNVNRWNTPDPGGRNVVKLDDPQTWNMYAYVGNNPTSRNDPSGLCNKYIGGCFARGLLANWEKWIDLAQQWWSPPSPPAPSPPGAPPEATLHTSILGNYTVFQWTDKKGGYHEDKVRSLVKVDSKSKPGATGPIHSYVVGQVKGLKSRAYGPEGAQIDTGDSRGRWIHGGGTSLGIHAYDPHQRLTPTFGCTRACNIDVQRLGTEITDFQVANPDTPIPYWRTDQ